mmetsp:Transcript_1457/g.3630  ORF Transcript_1457/g.3630 Transcript_1457/m.3630 type:complete len:214 (+) Transcript_1457:73-714(+)
MYARIGSGGKPPLLGLDGAYSAWCHGLLGKSASSNELTEHQNRTQSNNSSNRENNVRVSSNLLHRHCQANLSNKCGNKSHHHTDSSIIVDQKTKDNKGSGGSEGGEENHTSRCSRGHFRVNLHDQHEWSLHNTTTNSKHTGEESGETTEGRVHQSRSAIPFDITLDVLVSNACLQLPLPDQVVSGPKHDGKTPQKHESIGNPKAWASANNANG